MFRALCLAILITLAASPAGAVVQHLIPQLPQHLTICGQPVPLDRPLVRDHLDRELVIAVHDPAQVIMWLKRAGRYFPYIEQRLKQAGMPQDLKYLAVAESSLIHYIKSPAGAVGFWQFMPYTARRHGLRVDRWFDDRRNLAKSTNAALDYLKGLYAEFHSWPLAMAAYNCGEARLRDEIEQQDVKDYFDLALPRETQRYIYRILAVKIILSDPARYGYTMPPESIWKPVPCQHATLRLKRPLHLTVLAKAAHTSYRQIRELNPEIRRRYLPKGTYTVVVPPGQAQGLAARLAKGGSGPRATGDVYVVRKGDTLSEIADKHDVDIYDLRRANQIGRKGLIHPGQRLVIPEK